MGTTPNETTALASPLPPLKLGGHLAAEDTINTSAPVASAANTEAAFFAHDTFNHDISGWDVSRVINMEAMFGMATHFNQNIGNWDTAHVSDMAAMFCDASAFNQAIGNWNTSSVTDMNYSSMRQAASIRT